MHREEALEFCNIFHHEWDEGDYGYRCFNCGMFIPYGCEPWLPDDEDGLQHWGYDEERAE